MIKSKITYKSWIVILLVLVGTTNAVHGQKYFFKTYTVKDGLPRMGVYDLFQDQAGVLWIGSEGGGLVKFNGVRFESFGPSEGLASNKVRCVTKVGDLVYVGTDNGLFYLKNGLFHEVTGLSDEQKFVRDVSYFNDKLYVATDKGVVTVKDSAVTQVALGTYKSSVRTRVLEPWGDKLLIGTDVGPFILDKDGVQLFEGKVFGHHRILSAKKKGSQECIGTETGVFIRTAGGPFIEFTEEDGLLHNRVRSIAIDRADGVYIGTKSGVNYFSEGEFTLAFTEENGLSNNRIRKLTLGESGDLWIGTHYGGILNKRLPAFMLYNNSELTSNQIHSLTEDEKGDIIVGTSDGVTKIKVDGTFKLLNQGELETTVNWVHKDTSTQVYWFGTNRGLKLYKKNQYINTGGTALNKIVGSVTKILPKGESLLVLASTGLFEVLTNNGDYRVQKIKEGTYSDLFVLNGHLWLVHELKGAEVLDYNYTLVRSLPELTYITSAVYFNQHFVVATQGSGIKYFDDAFTLKGSFEEEDGLYSNYVFSLLPQDSSSIWVTHEKGVDLLFLNSKKIYSFGEKEGFLGIENVKGATHKDKFGRCWFGTLNGLFRLDNLNVPQTNTIHLELHVATFGGIVDQGAELDYVNRNLFIEWSPVYFGDVDRIQYKFKLHGVDEDWSVVNLNEIEYANLPPGEYIFEIVAIDEWGNYSKEPVEFGFVVLKPFWMKWWFITLIVIAIVYGLVLVYKWRVRSLKKKQLELEQIVQERTVELVEKNEIISDNHKKLEVQSKEIHDSIMYAKRIQEKILGSESFLKKYFEDYFILYDPKDIVSGDFYWFDEADEYLYVGLGDCTGHGVPGALVSIVCHNALQSALNEGNRKPSHILDRTRELVVEKLVDENSQLQDGMDIGLCSFHNEAGGITKAMFSGAHNPVWIIRNNEVIAVKGDKQPVGHYEHAKSFSKTNLDLMSGDVLILFSDGYPDQFGGPKGKKYSSKRLKQFFSQHQTSSLQEIKLALKSELVDWMRDEPQIDDIAIIGIKIK